MEKLRPEQKKLWRRTYLTAQEQGHAPVVAAEMADSAVRIWEVRGAFDETPSEASFVSPLGVVCPGSIDMARETVVRLGIAADLAVAYPNEPNAFTLIAWTQRGAELVRIASAEGFGRMTIAAQR